MQPSTTPDLQALLKEEFSKLPAPVQKAISSADFEKGLRALATEHKLMLDQWEILEDLTTETLMGLLPYEQFAQEIATSLNISSSVAIEISNAINDKIFTPIRAELENELHKPEPTVPETGPAAAQPGFAAQISGAGSLSKPPVKRASLAPAYISGGASHERKTIEGDPYREQTA